MVFLCLPVALVQAQIAENLSQTLQQLSKELLETAATLHTNNPSIVILDILNDVTRKRDQISEQAEAQLVEFLRRNTGYLVVEYPQIQAVREEWMGVFPDSSPAQIKQNIADILGADWVVSGSYRMTEVGIEFQLQLHEIESKRVIWQGKTKPLPEGSARESKEVLPETTMTVTALSPVMMASTSLPETITASPSISEEESPLGLEQPKALSVFPEKLEREGERKETVASLPSFGLIAHTSETIEWTEEVLEKNEPLEEAPQAKETLVTEGMVLIPAGPFLLGSVRGDEDEQPIHSVDLRSYYLDTHEVTNFEYDRCTVCERGSGGFDTVEYGQPVVYVDWENADKYCRFVGKRLPTEAEWEKGARAGSVTEYLEGDTPETLGNYAWYQKNTEAKGQFYAHVSGLKQPNAWGLYDMLGNVMEWTSDWYTPNYYQKSERFWENPQLLKEEYPLRVVRGGAWGGLFQAGTSEKLRSANRFAFAPWVRSFLIGFRCAADGPQPADHQGEKREEGKVKEEILEETQLPEGEILGNPFGFRRSFQPQ